MMNELLEVVNVLNSTKINALNETHQQWLQERYNLVNAQFEYAVCDKGYTLIGDTEALAKVTYYLGLDYDKEYELANLVVGSKQIIIYACESDRAYNLISTLLSLEKVF